MFVFLVSFVMISITKAWPMTYSGVGSSPGCRLSCHALPIAETLCCCPPSGNVGEVSRGPVRARQIPGKLCSMIVLMRVPSPVIMVGYVFVDQAVTIATQAAFEVFAGAPPANGWKKVPRADISGLAFLGPGACLFFGALSSSGKGRARGDQEAVIF